MGGGESAVAATETPAGYPSSAPEDARQTRAESIENAFGSAAHPAEREPSAANDASAPSAPPPVASDPTDPDSQ
jgi:hypothetical protein